MEQKKEREELMRWVNEIESTECEKKPERWEVTPDQEVWVKARILTAIRMGLSLKAERRVQADEFLYLYGIDAIAEGAAVEIIRLLGLHPAHINLRDYRKMLKQR